MKARNESCIIYKERPMKLYEIRVSKESSELFDLRKNVVIAKVLHNRRDRGEALDGLYAECNLLNSITNLTNRTISREEANAEVISVNNFDKNAVAVLFMFNSKPSKEEIHKRANKLAQIACGYGRERVLIDPPAFMAKALEDSLVALGKEVLYSFRNDFI